MICQTPIIDSNTTVNVKISADFFNTSNFLLIPLEIYNIVENMNVSPCLLMNNCKNEM